MTPTPFKPHSWQCADLKTAIFAGYSTQLENTQLQVECNEAPPRWYHGPRYPLDISSPTVTAAHQPHVVVSPPTSGGSLLPFTGLALGMVVFIAAMLLIGGLTLRKATSNRRNIRRYVRRRDG